MPPTVDGELRLPADALLPERYAIRRRVARGGMSSVWCAHDRVLGRSVAIKLLCETSAGDEAGLQRFMREARAAARLSGHPHVVTIYDVGEARGTDEAACAFIVMEYLAGGTVADALRVGAADHDDALRWITEAASAIDFAHAKGVIHRDLKPANFLLDGQRKLHVADFGIARLASEETLTSTNQLIGTAAYLAPERALGQPATEASDLYSLAVAAFELLAGQRPFVSDRVTEQLRLHVEAPPPRASRLDAALPPAVDRVLERGLAKEPERRWPSATAFAMALAEAMGAGPRPLVGASALAATAPTAAAPARRRDAAPPRRPVARQPLVIGPTNRHVRSRTAAVAVLAGVLVLAAVIAAFAASGGGTSARGGGHPRSLAAAHRAHHVPAHHRTRARPPAAVTTTTSTAPTSTTQQSSPPGASTLEAQGHALMQNGNYSQAIPVLRQAVGAAPANTITYAYALFDLGRSLRLAGDPRAAVPILWQRMHIPNQLGVVRQELQLALQALGQQYRTSGGPHDHGRGPGGNGPPGQGD